MDYPLWAACEDCGEEIAGPDNPVTFDLIFGFLREHGGHTTSTRGIFSKTPATSEENS